MSDKATRTRSQLIRSAATSFAEHGYARAKLSTISADAGVSRGALYFHFPSKEALADAVEAAAAERFAGVTSRWAEDGNQNLAEAVQAFTELYRQDVTFRAGVLLSREKDRKPAVNLLEQWESYVRSAVAVAERRHPFTRSGSAGSAASAIIALTVGLALLWHESEQWLTESTVSGVWNLLPPLVGRMD
ncbi:TetR family transcriptional regulator [Streptomyces sp. NPDC048179]|uniref:TetR family transcriptional regulator n=1 Tax=Streptomyces sp. NPDC048179 TaxID=3365506 RepID=UPI0037152BF7